MRDLTLTDGTVVKLDTKLNIKKLMMINRDFNTDQFATLRGTMKSVDFNILSASHAVYIAYRQANMIDYLSFDEFFDKYEFDANEAMEIYGDMIFGTNKKKFIPKH